MFVRYGPFESRIYPMNETNHFLQSLSIQLPTAPSRSTLLSIVWPINPRIAAHLSAVPLLTPSPFPRLSIPTISWPSTLELPPDINAIFFANRSISIATNFSFFLFAPGRLFKLLCLILVPSSPLLSPVPSLFVFSRGIAGNASPSPSRFVTSFFEGRRRLLIL